MEVVEEQPRRVVRAPRAILSGEAIDVDSLVVDSTRLRSLGYL